MSLPQTNTAAGDAFVPLDPGALVSPGKPAEGNPTLRVLPRSPGEPQFTPLQFHGSLSHGQKSSGEPTLTLQRDGDRVTGIRIECGCGQVIELACSYDK